MKRKAAMLVSAHAGLGRSMEALAIRQLALERGGNSRRSPSFQALTPLDFPVLLP